MYVFRFVRVKIVIEAEELKEANKRQTSEVSKRKKYVKKIYVYYINMY